MNLGIFFLLGLAGVLFFVPGLIAAFVAKAKGYRPWFWLLAMGPVGLLVIALNPGLDRATTPEERERWETRADWTGGILSGLTILPTMALTSVVLVGVFVLTTTVAKTARPVPAGTMISVPQQMVSPDAMQPIDETPARPEEASSELPSAGQ